MYEKFNWKRMLYILGIIILVFGGADPLEGSVMICIGSIMVALSTYLTHDRHWKIFLSSSVMIILGVGFMFLFSSLGGFGSGSTLSWWWGLLVLPYPIGWGITIVTLVVTIIAKVKENLQN